MEKAYIVKKTFPNTPQGLREMSEYKERNRQGHHFRTWGRCENVQEVFKKTGRHYSHYTNLSNSISMRSKEAQYCYEWDVYTYPAKLKPARQKFERPDRKTYKPDVNTYYMKKGEDCGFFSVSGIEIPKKTIAFSKGSPWGADVKPSDIPDDSVVVSCFKSKTEFHTMGCGCKFPKWKITNCYYGREIKYLYDFATVVISKRIRKH